MDGPAVGGRSVKTRCAAARKAAFRPPILQKHSQRGPELFAVTEPCRDVANDEPGVIVTQVMDDLRVPPATDASGFLSKLRRCEGRRRRWQRSRLGHCTRNRSDCRPCMAFRHI